MDNDHPAKHVKHAVSSMVSPHYLHLTFSKLFWIFVVGCFFGLIIEDIFHLIVYHEWESRAGLVWGPFSTIYGVGAVVLTLFLNRFYYTHNIIIFLISMVLGSTMEYITSWMMEVFFHAIAWDYSNTFGSIDGRTNFLFGVMWGALGLGWVRIIMPLIKSAFHRINFKNTVVRMITAIMVVFMATNIIVTALALHREGERAVDIPAASALDIWLDDWFPDEWMQERFHNMTVSSDVGSQN